MQLRWGRTRIVVLHKRRAYKIAQVRPVRTIVKILVILFSHDQYWRLQTKYHTRLLPALWRYLWAGIYANRAESSYWQRTHDDRCVPVVDSWWGGLVIVQAFASPVTLQQIQQSRISSLLAEMELGSYWQYGEYQGECRVLDYAHWG